MELPDLVEAALQTYLTGLQANGQTVWPPTMQRGAGQNFQLRIFKGEDEQDRDGQCLTVKAERDYPEHVPSSAVYEVPCEVVLRTPARKLTNAEAAAGAQQVTDPVQSHQQAAEAMRAAVMANGLELALTGAQAGLTVFGVLRRNPTRSQQEGYWESGFAFSLVCCAQSFPN